MTPEEALLALRAVATLRTALLGLALYAFARLTVYVWRPLLDRVFVSTSVVRFVPYDASAMGSATVCVDCTHRNLPTLTHHKDGSTPKHLRGDTSTDTVFNALRAGWRPLKIANAVTCNHFDIDGKWYLVDLPGFGYAKVSKKDRQQWMKVTKQYLDSRVNLLCVMMLVDSRIPAQKVDLEFMAWMGEVGLPFVLVFTKVDKLNKTEAASFLPAYEAEMLKQWHKMPPTFVTSGSTGQGREDVLRFIHQTNGLFRA